VEELQPSPCGLCDGVSLRLRVGLGLRVSLVRWRRGFATAEGCLQYCRVGDEPLADVLFDGFLEATVQAADAAEKDEPQATHTVAMRNGRTMGRCGTELSMTGLPSKEGTP